MKSNATMITTVVRRIPKGKVATYGQVARLAGLPQNARQVGFVLKSLPDGSEIAWHRVINSQGRISERGDGTSEHIQRQLLESEGVEFIDEMRVDLSQHLWQKDA